MNNAGRYLFPLVVVAAIAWLAVTTLGSGDDSKQKVTFSQMLVRARQQPDDFRLVTFHPSRQQIDIEFDDGKEVTVAYPVDASAFEFQQALEKSSVPFDAKARASSPWWDILTSLLPFVLLFGFWIYLMRMVQARKAGPA